MLNEFRNIPVPLQKKILVQLGAGFILLILSAFIILVFRDAEAVLPCLTAFIFFIISAWRTLLTAALGEYVIISGECEQIEKTAFRNHIKAITILSDGKKIRVILKQRLHKFTKGMKIDFYVYQDTTVYENGNGYLLRNYITLASK